MSRFERFIFLLLVFIGTVLTGAFGIWWFEFAHIPHNFHGWWHIFDAFIFLLLSYTVWHQITTELLLWLIADKIRHRPRTPVPAPGLKVAFITTFVPGSESPDLLEHILPSLKATHYKHDTWLLDEGDDATAKEICAKYGVFYFSRKGISAYNTKGGKFAAKTKGGNHNAWYDAYGHGYDIVAQIDTDFIPRRNFLTRTLGYFQDNDVAFVITPQIYGNEQDSLVARGAAEQQFMFYGPILRGLHGQDMAMLLGANHVIRVAALKDIDYYGGHLTEDLLTGMTLHANRWKSVYVPEALAIGEGPSTWLDYFNQQTRWAFGCMHILFTRGAGLLGKMAKRNRIYYFLMMQHYFTGLAMMVGVILILSYFFFGLSSANMGIDGIIHWYVPLLFWQFFISTWLQMFNVRPRLESGLLLGGKLVSIASWPIYFLALVGVLRGQHLKFKVTPKGKIRSNATPLAIFMPHLVIAGMMTVGFLYSFVVHRENPIMEFWAITTMVLLYGVVITSQKPEWGHSLKKLVALEFHEAMYYMATGRKLHRQRMS